MPIYIYRCESCGVTFDRFQKFSDKPLTRCPECSKGKVKRILQPPAIVFKGSGWYATDHRSPSGQTSKKSESDASEKTETKPAKKETKPAAKSED